MPASLGKGQQSESPVANLIKRSTIVIYDSRVVLPIKLPILRRRFISMATVIIRQVLLRFDMGQPNLLINIILLL